MKLGITYYGRGFLKSEKGQFSLIAALMGTALIGAVGVAVDYNHFDKELVKGQSALDAAALAMVEIVEEKGVSSSKNDARTIVDANYPPDEFQSLKVKTLSMTEDQNLHITATLHVGSLFGDIVGISAYETDIESLVNTSTTMPYENLNVAIALDSSTSMTSLIADTRDAIDALYTTISDNELDGEFSIFPFSQYDANRNGDLMMENKDIWLDNIEITSYISDLSVMTSNPASNVNYPGTYSGTGAACGWEALEQANNAITTIEPETLNVVYFMHDGDGYCGADDKIIETCHKIRDRGIKMVGVRFGSWSGKDQLFLDCVGDPENYYYADTASTTLVAFVEGAFGDINEKYIMK